MGEVRIMRRWLIFDKGWQNGLFIGFFAVLPYMMEAWLGSTASLGAQILIFAVMGLGFNILLGYTGLLSFGHGMFLGMGMYGTTLIQVRYLQGSFVLPVLFGVALSTAVGVAVGYLVMRKRGVYFSLLTLAFTQLFFYVCFRWTALTGGENGMSGIQRPENLLGLNLKNDYVFYYFCLAVLLVCTVVVKRILNAPFGRVLQAIRDNEVRASAVGYNTKRYKHLAVVISAAFCGLAGSLYAFLLYFAFPLVFQAAFGGEIVAMTVVGGMRNFFGPVMGGAVYVLIQDLLSSYTKNWMVFFGILFMAFILFSPNGILGIAERIAARFGRRRGAGAGPHAEAVAGEAADLNPPGSGPRPVLGEEIFRVEGATKRFGGLAAVDGVSFSVRKGELHTIIGPNGAGKTTLFNLLTGHLPMDGGKVFFKGADITGKAPYDIANLGMARSFQIISIFKDLTVYENIRVAVQSKTAYRFSLLAETDRLAEINGRAEALLRQMGLVALRNRLAATISHGDQRLLEIAITLAIEPEMLFLDEPLAGLAAKERVKTARLIRSLAGERTVLLIDHDIDQVLAISDRLTVLAQGKVIAAGTPEEVKNNPVVQEAYIGGTEVRKTAMEEPPSREGQPLLEVKGLNTYYGKSHILHDVSMKVYPGELVCFLGRNGAGKTTTLYSIMGHLSPQSGEVFLEGRQIAREKPENVARLGIQIVPQGRRVFPNLTVMENLKIAALQAERRGEALRWTPEKAFELLPPLRKLQDRRGETLSGGELQMVAIARALMGNGKVLMLDEPFEGLAPAIVEGLWKVIRELKKEMTIVLVEQNADVALSLGDRAYVINNGMIEYEGTARRLVEENALRVKLLGV
jgi:branched-chain amino acid transport system ATP-binding protein